MSDCPRGDVRDLLPDLVHGSLDAAAREEVEGHVAACPSCAAELELLRSLRSALASGPAVDVERIAAAVRAAPRARVPQRAAGARRRLGGWRAAAAVLLAALGIGALSLARRSGRNATPPVVTAASVRPETTVHAPGDGLPSSTTPGTAAVAASGAAPVGPVDAGLMFDGGVGDLSDANLRSLIAAVDTIDALPRLEPEAVTDQAGEGAL